MKERYKLSKEEKRQHLKFWARCSAEVMAEWRAQPGQLHKDVLQLTEREASFLVRIIRGRAHDMLVEWRLTKTKIIPDRSKWAPVDWKEMSDEK